MLNPIRLGSTLMASALVLATTPGYGVAGDGVIELSQSCAVNTGCMADDTPGFPVSITQPGSYKLTSFLAADGAVANLIEVDSSDVTIDLNDFSLLGGTSCSGTARPNVTTCTISGFSDTGVRILLPASGRHRFVTIRNGGISGMRSNGIDASQGRDTFIEDVSVTKCGGEGIIAARASTVRRSQAVLCGSNGVRVFREVLVESVHSRSNGGHGFSADDGSILSQVTAVLNSGRGATCGTGVSVLDSAFRFNGQNGIFMDGFGLVSRTTSIANIGHGVEANSNTSVRDGVFNVNTLDGVNCTFGCTIVRNITDANAGDGIEVIGAGAANVIGNNATRNTEFGLRTGGNRVYFNQNNLENNTGGAFDGGGSSHSGGKNNCSGALC